MHRHAPNEDRPDHLPGLTGLRFLAAFVVLFEHSRDLLPQAVHVQHHWFTTHLGFLGMTLFFVLSGFVITHNYLGAFARGTRAAMYDFLTARMARLLPLFVVLLAAQMLAPSFREQSQLLAYLVPLHLTPLYSMFGWLRNGGGEVLQYFGLAWSISTEWAFYLCFPALAIGLARLRKPGAVVACALLCVLAACAAHYRVYATRGEPFSLYLFWMGAPPGDLSRDVFACVFAYTSPLLRVFDFVLGCLAARLFWLVRDRVVTPRERRWAHAGFAALCVMTAGMEWAIGDHHPIAILPGSDWKPLPEVPFAQFLRFSFLHAPFLACLLLYVTRYPSPLRWLADRPLLMLAGEASYSIYLSHRWVLPWFEYPAGGGTEIDASTLAGGVFRLALATVVVIAVSRGLYVLIEIPGKRLIRRLARRLAGGARLPAMTLLLCALLYVIVPATGLLLAVRWFFHPPGLP